MTDTDFRRAGAWAAFALAASSILYAVAYLVIMPSEQRSGDTLEYFQSYLEDPTGRRLASIMFIVGGLAGAFATAALAERLRPVSEAWARWLAIAGVADNIIGMAHGLWNFERIEELSTSAYLRSPEASVGTLELIFNQPSAVDPQGLFRFGVSGLLALIFGLLIRRAADLPDWLGWLGVALGVDLIVLFFADWLEINTLVLLTGALASLVLLPGFRVWVGLLLRRPSQAGGVS